MKLGNHRILGADSAAGAPGRQLDLMKLHGERVIGQEITGKKLPYPGNIRTASLGGGSLKMQR